MRSLRWFSRVLITLIAAVLVIGATSAFGCAICKASPDGVFGNCRQGYDRGWNTCTTYVKDNFSGATSCELEDSSCGTTAELGGSGLDNPNCAWTDVYGNCIAYY